ncbi:MAG: helix-turn-helix domain-containing protein [Clostridia bacterium]|nr:helix-turn-helix domain-containing protein [Clostridia bacterium]
MELGRNIRFLRRRARMSMDALAERLGVSRQTIYRYEMGVIQNVPADKLCEMAALFGVSVGALFSEEAPMHPREEACRAPRGVPMLGEVACGRPIFAEGVADGYYIPPDGVRADFCLRAKGDSMTGARIFDGDLVFVRAQSAVQNGQIGVVVIEDEATLKRVYYYPERDTLVLYPENPAFSPIVLVGAELEGVHILGLAVGVFARFA